MSYSKTHQWKELAKEIVQAIACGAEIHRLYSSSVLIQASLKKIANGEIRYPSVKTKLHIYRCIQEIRQSNVEVMEN